MEQENPSLAPNFETLFNSLKEKEVLALMNEVCVEANLRLSKINVNVVLV